MTTLESTHERLEDALRRLAVEAADLFEELLASGAELPFDLEPTVTEDSPLPMYSYAPLTGQFIDHHVAELRRLEAFVEVRELTSEEVAIGFLNGLWEGRSEFEVAGDRLKGAIDGVLASLGGSEGGEATPAGEIIVPLVGFRMPADEITLDGVRIVKSESVGDAPMDAIEATRQGKGGKPGFVAVVNCRFANLAPAAAVADDLQRTLRTLRLFRPGAVGLGAHGWARRADGWERFSTGCGRVRNGGYRLTGNEVGELEQFSHSLTERGARLPALAWASSRYDLGAERASLIEALSDYLLALRGLLEGGGPANLGLSARVSILAAEPSEREAARRCVERALTIERKLMSGARYRPKADASPLATINELEELLRRLLKGLATGELQGDLRELADERLLAEGMSVGTTSQEPAMGETAEWRLPDPTPDDELDLSTIADGNMGEIEIRRTSEDDSDGVEETTREAPEPTTRIVVTDVELPDIMGDESKTPDPFERSTANEFADADTEKADWFAAGEGELEWPAFASPRRDRDAGERPSKNSEDVRYLFPVPDSTDWDVGELRYERKRSS